MSKNDLQLSKPPLNLLLNPTVLKAKKPWEIDVVLLLELFTDFLEKKGDKNLRLCANAALSSFSAFPKLSAATVARSVFIFLTVSVHS